MVETRETYGITNIHELHNAMQKRFSKIKVALGYSQITDFLAIKKEQEQSINTENLRYEFCINFGKKDW